jgi:hypothetical protein
LKLLYFFGLWTRRLAMSVSLREYFGMATRNGKTPSQRPRKGAEIRLRGKRIATLDEGLTMVRTGPSIAGLRPRRADQAAAMLRKTGKALNKPGISRHSIFTNNSGDIFAYSADPLDATKLVRTSRDGTRRRGRVVGGKFKVT